MVYVFIYCFRTENPTNELFAQAEKDIFDLMKVNSYAIFVVSSLYNDIKEEDGKYHISSDYYSKLFVSVENAKPLKVAQSPLRERFPSVMSYNISGMNLSLSTSSCLCLLIGTCSCSDCVWEVFQGSGRVRSSHNRIQSVPSAVLELS